MNIVVLLLLSPLVLHGSHHGELSGGLHARLGALSAIEGAEVVLESKLGQLQFGQLDFLLWLLHVGIGFTWEVVVNRIVSIFLERGLGNYEFLITLCLACFKILLL